MSARDEPVNTLRLIAGSGRSGTTWVLDALASANGLRPVFEPLNPYTSTVAWKYANRYLAPDETHPELLNLLADGASGDLFTLWTHYRILKPRLIPRAKHLRSYRELKRLGVDWRKAITQLRTPMAPRSNMDTLVKCVRANLLLGWVQAHFDSRIVLILRHPGAVVESQLRSSYLAWDPYPLLERYRTEPKLMDGPLRAYAHLFEEKLSPAAALTLVWGIQNLVPITELDSASASIVFYEELLENPAAEWATAVAALGLESSPSLEVLEKPSQQAAARWNPDGAPADGYSVAHGRWGERLGTEECRDVQSMLEALGIAFYNVNRGRPDLAAFDARFGKRFRGWACASTPGVAAAS
jgi:hypothetical protein